MKIYNPVNCTFIENQNIEKQIVEQQLVQQQLVGTVDRPGRPMEAADISAADLTWLRTTWSIPERQDYIMLLREALQEESARYECVNRNKKKVLFGVMHPRYLRGEIVDMPQYRTAKRLFGDLPCFPSENNYNQAVDSIRSGQL